jgi:hypothetical protein
MSKRNVEMLNFVTNHEWKQFRPGYQFSQTDANKGVVCITHHEAMEYAAWLSKETGRKLRLPTEDELKAEEATFTADFSKHPLPAQPDVGTFGTNANGVTDLLGVLYTWVANASDVDKARAGWSVNTAQTPISNSSKDVTPKVKSSLDQDSDLSLDLETLKLSEISELKFRMGDLIDRLEDQLKNVRKKYGALVNLMLVAKDAKDVFTKK